MMRQKNDKLPIIIGMNPPTKEVLIFPHRHWDGTKTGYDVMINHAVFPEGTQRGQKFKMSDEVTRKGTACVMHFTDGDAMRRFGQMLIDFAERRDA